MAPALAQAFDADCHGHDEQTERVLRDATIALVVRLKEDDVLPERVIVAVKAAIATYSHLHRVPSLIDETDDLPGERSAATYRRVFTWCLDAYFGTASA